MWVDILLNLFYWRKLKIWISFLWNKKCIKYWWTVDHMYCKTFENMTHQDGGDEWSPERCQRPSSESAPTTMLPIPTATPNRDRPADTMVCFHRTTTEALRRARSASGKKPQSNYKGRTNCYKVIISWEKNPLNLWILRLFWRKLLCRLSESWNLRSV